MARPQGAHASRNTISRCSTIPNEKMPPIVGRLDQAFRPHRREALGRRRADHPPPARRARRIRRAVHPRDHLDRQPHLPVRPPRLAGGHAGHRRPDLDDPLHQQGVPDGAAGLQPGADAADRHAGRRRRPAQGDGRARPAAGGEDSRRLVLARRAQGALRWRSSSASPTSCSRRPTCCWRRNSCRPSSTGGSACWPASRCSCASTAWRAATGRSSSTGADGSVARGRLPHLRARPGAARAHRHRGARRPPDRRGLLRRRRQADRPAASW